MLPGIVCSVTMCHYYEDVAELDAKEQEREDASEADIREELEAELDKEKFVALGLIM